MFSLALNPFETSTFIFMKEEDRKGEGAKSVSGGVSRKERQTKKKKKNHQTRN